MIYSCIQLKNKTACWSSSVVEHSDLICLKGQRVQIPLTGAYFFYLNFIFETFFRYLSLRPLAGQRSVYKIVTLHVAQILVWFRCVKMKCDIAAAIVFNFIVIAIATTIAIVVITVS